jgi:membrane protein DedA with SNARE-associated domain
MQLLEYLWLVIALFFGVTLAMQYQTMSNDDRLIYIVGIVLAAFMFGFRRTQRLRKNKHKP